MFTNEALLELRDQRQKRGTYSQGVDNSTGASAEETPPSVPAQPNVTQPAPVPAPAPAATPLPKAAANGSRPSSGVAGPAVAIPELKKWEQDMVTYGRRHCAYYDTAGLTKDERLGHTYYDAMRVFYQIGEYTLDKSWNDCAAKARAAYRDAYVLANDGAVAGYWNFSSGIRMDWERTGDPLSKTAGIKISQRAAFAADTTPLAWTEHTSVSREVAYAIMSYVNAEALGEPRRARLAALANQALGHIDQWFVSRTSRAPVPFDLVPQAAGKYYLQPFMVGITAQALIRYWEETADPRVLPAVKAALDTLWERAWVPADQAFWYENWVADPRQQFPSAAGAPDLNLLIAPAFAWVHQQTDDSRYRDRGDLIFAGGVKKAWLAGGKQFNQNYMWSFDYVRSRTR